MEKSNMEFYKCPICGNVIGLIEGKTEHLTCCGKEMQLLIANTEDAATEKHVPIYEKVGNEIVVKVGEIEHPMEKDHYIMWVAQEWENQISMRKLYPEEKILVKFNYIPNSTIYAYCNKHGLWKTKLQ